jgi:hypothetical protein
MNPLALFPIHAACAFGLVLSTWLTWRFWLRPAKYRRTERTSMDESS